MSFPVPHGPRICLVGQHGQYQQIFIRLNSNGLGGSTSLDYGIQDAYFCIPPHISGKDMGPVQMKNLRNPNVVELVNIGAYPDLAVSDFSITFSPAKPPALKAAISKSATSFTVSQTPPKRAPFKALFAS